MKLKRFIDMRQSKKHTFKKVLQSAPLAVPAANFTATVMREIEDGIELEMSIAPSLASMLKKGQPVQAAPDFTALVMTNIEQLPNQKIYQPIISKKLGLTIAALVIITLSIISFIGKIGLTATGSAKSQFQTLHVLQEVPLFYPLLIMSTALLMVLDYVVNKKKQRN